MSKLNGDVLSLIFKELKLGETRKNASLCLVNKTWCEIIIPILWMNPWGWVRYSSDWRKKSQFNVIISHLSNEAKENLRIQGINLPATQQKPIFNYISFFKHLNLRYFNNLIIYFIDNIEKSKIPIVKNEILKLFINKNMRISHLYIDSADYQIHLIPGAEDCFSNLKFLEYYNDNFNFNPNNSNDLEELAKISKLIKTLNICNISFMEPKKIPGIAKFIEAQKSLNSVNFFYTKASVRDELVYRKILEYSLIKHADTIRYLQIDWVPITEILSYLTNLISLEVRGDYCHELLTSNFCNNWKLDYASLPALKILKSLRLSNHLASLIESTKGHLTEISIEYGDDDDKGHIRAIYQNCPNLEYLRLSFSNDNFSELKELLINCQYLNGLIIYLDCRVIIDWKKLFEILTKLSPTSLFKFKFNRFEPELESLRLFLDDWEGRHPMLLHVGIKSKTYQDLFEQSKAKGIVQKCYLYNQDDFYADNFEWIVNEDHFRCI